MLLFCICCIFHIRTPGRHEITSSVSSCPWHSCPQAHGAARDAAAAQQELRPSVQGASLGPQGSVCSSLTMCSAFLLTEMVHQEPSLPKKIKMRSLKGTVSPSSHPPHPLLTPEGSQPDLIPNISKLHILIF